VRRRGRAREQRAPRGECEASGQRPGVEYTWRLEVSRGSAGVVRQRAREPSPFVYTFYSRRGAGIPLPNQHKDWTTAPPAVAPAPLTSGPSRGWRQRCALPVTAAAAAGRRARWAGWVVVAGIRGGGGCRRRLGGARRHSPWPRRAPPRPPMGRDVILTLARGWGAPVRGGGEGGAPFVSPLLRRWYAPRKTKWLQVRCAATAGLKNLAPSWQQQ